jgi:hypothetical protein
MKFQAKRARKNISPFENVKDKSRIVEIVICQWHFFQISLYPQLAFYTCYIKFYGGFDDSPRPLAHIYDPLIQIDKLFVLRPSTRRPG